MDIKKNSQQALFKELSRFEINAVNPPEYNGYSIDDMGVYMKRLDILSENFQNELSDNLTSLSPSLEIYFTDILKLITGIKEKVRSEQKEEIHDTLRENSEIFKRNKLGYVNQVINYQREIIDRTITGISQRLELVKNPDLFKAIVESPAPHIDIAGESPIFKTKIKSRLSRIELTTLLWLLTEAKCFEFEWNDEFVKFVENNFQFSRKEGQYDDMVHIGSLMTKLRSHAETDRDQQKEYLMGELKNTHLPDESEPSVLKIRKNSTKKEQSATVKKVQKANEALKLDTPKE